MSDETILFRLVEDVGGLKKEVQGQREAQSAQWRKIDEVKALLVECNHKLEQVVIHEERLRAVEDGVEDYRKSKSRLVSVMAGIGLGAGGFSGLISTWLVKFFGNSGG